MKIGEITESDVISYLRIEPEDADPGLLSAIMDASKQYISDYTGIPIASEDPTLDTLDNHPDFYIVFMVLCQDMYDNRSMYVDRNNLNKVVETILGMHCRNLL